MIGDQGFTIGQPECLLGIIPGGGGSQKLPRLIGKSKALELMLKGTQLTPEEAKAIGLITDVFKKEELHQKVQTFADLISKRPPIAIDAIKKAVHQGMNADLLHGLSLEMIQSIRCFDTEDVQKAMNGYLKIIKEKIDVPKDERLSMAELLNILENASFVDKFKGG